MSYATPIFDHQYARNAVGMREMFITVLSVKHIACFEANELFLTINASVDVDGTVEHDKNLGTVVDMPFVWFVGPVQPYGRVVDRFNVECVPSLQARIVARAIDFILCS
ncbi:hypothetical protein [Palleronia sediminis]|uniref:hypothetical protein n=1 Tax=Palleronia sediminis TaxID=2547833 RepID=UPI001981BE3A|nr:hypothetical protein [Palleronia sediminis]